MTREAMIRMLRVHLNDEDKIGWEFDDELVDFLDRATAFLTNTLITMKHNSLIKPLLIKGETVLPDDFVSFVGKLPIQIAGGVAIPYGVINKQPVPPHWENANWRYRPHEPTWRDTSVPDPVWDVEAKAWEEYWTHPEFKVFYWSRLPYVSSFADTDTLPYSHEFATQITDVARMLALNKNEYELTQDVNLFTQVQNALASVTRGAEQ